MHSERVKVGILGGGLTGLTLGAALKRSGLTCRVWETAAVAGGAIRTRERSGFLIEDGPNSMLIKSAQVLSWLEEDLGLGPQLCQVKPDAAKRFIVRDGQPCALPASLFSAIGTPLYSRAAKLRILKEPWVRKGTEDDESVGSFVRRRLGPEFLDYGISCLVSGIYAGDPDALSIRHAFPKVWNLEREHGSLIRGALALKRKRRESGVPAFKSRMVSFDKGLKVLVDRLVAELGSFLHLSTRWKSIRLGESGWECVEEVDGQLQRVIADKLVITLPQWQWDTLPFEDAGSAADSSLKSEMLQTQSLEYPPLSTLVLGFPRKAVQHALDGFGMLIPAVENRFILGTIFSSSLFPDRAPPDHVSLMNFIGGVLQPDRAGLTQDELVEGTCRELRQLLGIEGEPAMVHHCYWPKSIPQYSVGHQRFLNQISQLERKYPGLCIQGNYRGGPGLSDCMEQALKLHGKLLQESLP